MFIMTLYKCVLFLFCLFHLHLCHFNVEELKWVNYDVDILVTPVKKEEISNSIVHITSKSGQEFQCSLPQLNDDETSEKVVANGKEQDVLELLKPMKTSSCLTKSKDWWTYEFCFGHYIKQYHVEDGHITGQVITLGLFESDYDWNNETDHEKFKHTKQKYHSQYYVNGSKCDLTGKPRNAEVRIYCEEDVGDFIYRVDEPGTCSYIITVHTSRLCSHPKLKPLPSNKAHLISCNPLLNDAQYLVYLQKVQDKIALDKKMRNEWLSMQQKKLGLRDSFVKHNDIDKLLTSLTSQNIVSLKDDNFNVEKFIENIFEEARMTYNSKYDKSKDKNIFKNMFISALDVLVKRLMEVQQETSVVKKELLEKFIDNEKLKTLLTPENYELFKETAESAGLKSDELNKHNGQTKNTLSSNLLLEKLNKAETDLAEAIKRVSKIQTLMSEDKLDETLKVINKDKDAETPSTEDDDDKLQIRIRRLDRRLSDTSSTLHEMDFEQRKKLEQAVKDKLEKAGLDTGGRKIEVKIITAGYFDNEEGKDFQSLSDEETEQFQNMIMALLTGQQEAVQEMKKNKKLEDSYKFVWDTDNNEIGVEED